MDGPFPPYVAKGCGRVGLDEWGAREGGYSDGGHWRRCRRPHCPSQGVDIC